MAEEAGRPHSQDRCRRRRCRHRLLGSKEAEEAEEAEAEEEEEEAAGILRSWDRCLHHRCLRRFLGSLDRCSQTLEPDRARDKW